MSVAEWGRAAADRLVDAGFDRIAANRDVAVLARACLGWDAATWLLRQPAPLPATDRAALDAWVGRRATGEPVAYLTGRREFYGRDFAVTPAVLIPRPETEHLVEAALHLAGRPPAPLRILDVGTGSGCIAVTLAIELAASRVTATDISEDALEIARRNAVTHDVADRIDFVEAPLTANRVEAFDVIVSNPPYVPETDRALLQRDVRDFEPASALFGGDDGLDVIRVLLPAAHRALVPGGVLFMEIGAGQADAVSSLVTAAGLELIEIRPDLASIPRVAVARKP